MRRTLLTWLCLACLGACSPAAAPASCREDGSCLVYSPTGATSAQNPCYSPDSNEILFTLWHRGYNAGPAGLYVARATPGGSSHPVLDDGASNVNLPGSCWNAATSRITFASDRAGGKEEIFTSKADGGDIMQITRLAGTDFIEPSFSPDGNEIVFEAGAGAGSVEIWKARADGSGLVRLTSGGVDREPNWSPAGDQILFQRLAGGWAIYTMRPDGSNLMRVTSPQQSSTDASFSPDGKRIVYSSSGGRPGGDSLFVIAAGGGSPQRITDQQGYDGAPTWSPDGLWLAFESSPDPAGVAPTSLWRILAPR